MDNGTQAIDKRVFHGCAQVFVGALYPFHGEIPTNDIGKSMDGGLRSMKKIKFSNNNHNLVSANSV